jgi:hypothetical protein
MVWAIRTRSAAIAVLAVSIAVVIVVAAIAAEGHLLVPALATLDTIDGRIVGQRRAVTRGRVHWAPFFWPAVPGLPIPVSTAVAPVAGHRKAHDHQAYRSHLHSSIWSEGA